MCKTQKKVASSCKYLYSAAPLRSVTFFLLLFKTRLRILETPKQRKGYGYLYTQMSRNALFSIHICLIFLPAPFILNKVKGRIHKKVTAILFGACFAFHFYLKFHFGTARDYLEQKSRFTIHLTPTSIQADVRGTRVIDFLRRSPDSSSFSLLSLAFPFLSLRLRARSTRRKYIFLQCISDRLR